MHSCPLIGEVERLQAALDVERSKVRLLREQRTYLVRRLRDQAGPDDHHATLLIRKLRKTLRNTRTMFETQTAATKRQKDKTRRAGSYNHAMTAEVERLREVEADAAAMRIVLDRIGGSDGARPTGLYAAELARNVLDNSSAGAELLADYRRALSFAKPAGYQPASGGA